MPLVAHSKLPTFEHLREQGHELLTVDRAVHQDIRELRTTVLQVGGGLIATMLIGFLGDLAAILTTA